jgi:DNA-binding transcriptional LysR family regulator
MQLDLNLLTALDALLEEGSVTGAAERLHLSPPAMSRTLGRLRRVMNDQLLVRTGRTMTPTPRAVAIREEIHVLVQQAQAVLAPADELDLDSLERTFTMQWNDAITAAIGPGLVADLQRTAPGVRLRQLPETIVDTADLRYGRVDLEIGATLPELPEISHLTVGHDRLVLAVRPGHPAATGRLTAARFAEYGRMTISRRGRLTDAINGQLQALGLDSHVVGSTPTSTLALIFASSADVLVPVPERLSHPLVDALGLVTRPMPFDLPPVPVILAWHQRYDGDLAHKWLRGRIEAALKVLLEKSG